MMIKSVFYIGCAVVKFSSCGLWWWSGVVGVGGWMMWFGGVDGGGRWWWSIITEIWLVPTGGSGGEGGQVKKRIFTQG